MINTTIFGSGSSGNGYLIDDGSVWLMIEAGMPYKRVAPRMAFRFSQVAAMFISHEHGDHSKYIRQYLSKTEMTMYMSAGTAKALELPLSYRVVIMEPLKEYQIGTWTVTGFPVEHDAAEPMGFIFDNNQGDRLLYVTDTYYVKYCFSKITHMLVEMNYAEDIAQERVDRGELDYTLHSRILTSHFEMTNALTFIGVNLSKYLKQVTLIHLSRDNGDPERFKRKTQQLTGVPVTIAGR